MAPFPFSLLHLFHCPYMQKSKKLHYEIIVHCSPLKSIRLSLVKSFSHAKKKKKQKRISTERGPFSATESYDLTSPAYQNPDNHINHKVTG